MRKQHKFKYNSYYDPNNKKAFKILCILCKDNAMFYFFTKRILDISKYFTYYF